MKYQELVNDLNDVATRFGKQNSKIDTVCQSAASALHLQDAELVKVKRQLDDEQERRVRAENQRDDAEQRCSRWKDLLDASQCAAVPLTLEAGIETKRSRNVRFPYERIAETIRDYPAFFVRTRIVDKNTTAPCTTQVTDCLRKAGYNNMFVRFERKCFPDTILVAGLDAINTRCWDRPSLGEFVLSGECAFQADIKAAAGTTSQLKARAAQIGFGGVLSALCRGTKMVVFRLDKIQTFDFLEEEETENESV